MLERGLELIGDVEGQPIGENGELNYERMHVFDGEIEVRISTRLNDEGERVIMIGANLKKFPLLPDLEEIPEELRETIPDDIDLMSF